MEFWRLLSLTETPAAFAAQLCLQRRNVENIFGTVTENYEGQVKTLCYPSSALFSVFLALVIYYILATVSAILASVHDFGKIEAGLSDYYMVDEIKSTYRAIMIAINAENWSVFADGDRQLLAEILLDLAARIHLKKFLKQPRASKKNKEPPPKRFTSSPCINCPTSQPRSANTLTGLAPRTLLLGLY